MSFGSTFCCGLFTWNFCWFFFSIVEKLRFSLITWPDFITDTYSTKVLCFFFVVLCSKWKTEIDWKGRLFYFDFNACYLVINACMNARNAATAACYHGCIHIIRTLPVYNSYLLLYYKRTNLFSRVSSQARGIKKKTTTSSSSSRIQYAHRKICIRAPMFFSVVSYKTYSILLFLVDAVLF